MAGRRNKESESIGREQKPVAGRCCTGADSAAKGQVNCCVCTGTGSSSVLQMRNIRRAGERRHLVAPGTGLQLVEDACIHRVTMVAEGKRVPLPAVDLKKKTEISLKNFVVINECAWDVL